MAKLKAPLLSLSAVGHFSKSMTFFSHTGRSYITRQGYKRDMNIGQLAGFGRMYFGVYLFGYSGRVNLLFGSLSQILQRSLFSACWVSYAELNEQQKLELDIEAKSLQISGANLFMSRYLKENN